MNPSTRDRLRRAWGFCERHAWGWMAVEASFRGGYMHGPAVLYEDLMERAVTFLDVYGPMQLTRVRRSLREKGPCLMCEEGYGSESRAFAKAEIVDRGRDLSQLRSMAQRTYPYWREAVCGHCASTDSAARCRKHLLNEVGLASAKKFQLHKEFVTDICHHLVKYSRSFRWGFHDTRTDQDTAALIMAVGWCSGWRLFFSILGEQCLAV